METNSYNEEKATNVNNPVEEFNLGLLLYVVKKSILWLLLIIIISITLSIIYLRYSPRIYQASATLMLKTEKTTQILGVQQIVSEQDETEISREIQLIRSKLLIERTINHLPLQVGYYKEGKTKFIFSELYTSTPFEVDGSLKSTDMANIPIYVKLINSRRYYLNFTLGGKEYEYRADTGQIISNPFFSIAIHFRSAVKKEELEGIYYFKFFTRAELVQEISSKLEVLPLDHKTQTIRLLYQDRNPARAAAIVATAAEEFVKYDIERKRESILGILYFIQNQIDTFSKSYDYYLDSISQMQLKEGFWDKGPDYVSNLSNRLLEYEQRFRDYEYDINLLKTYRTLLNESKEYANLPSVRFKILTDDFDSKIVLINDLQNQRTLLLLDATEQHPNVRLTDKKIADSKQKLDREIQNATKGLQSAYNQLRDEYYQYIDEVKRFPGLQNKYGRLDKLADEKNTFLLNLYAQLSNYLIASAGIVSDYVLLERANIPQVPISPRDENIKIVGFVVGLFLCVVFIVMRYLTQNTIISISDIERHTNIPLIGIIPKYKDELLRSKVVVTQDPKSTITEAFRAVRGNLQFLLNDSGSKIVSTTSTIPGEGKTFVSINLAAILSMLDKRVIILDFDMRKPRLDKVFEVDNYKGVSSILSGQVTIEDCVIHTEIRNLDLITSGPVPPNPSELILLPKLEEVVNQLKSKYDYVIIDTPPLGLVTDALELLKISNYPIYVLRAAYSKKSVLQGINKLVKDAKITNLALVLNDFGRGASAYGPTYGHGYSYAYGYGYGYGADQYGEGYYTSDNKVKDPWYKRIFG